MTQPETQQPLLKSWPLLGLVAFNIFLFWLLLFKKSFGANVVIFELTSLFYIIAIGKNKSTLFYTKVVLAALLSLFFWIRADFVVTSLSFLTILLLNSVILYEAISGSLVPRAYFLNLPTTSLLKVFVYTKKVFTSLLSWKKYLKVSRVDSSNTDNIGRVFVGVFVSLPVLIILVLLFSAADQNFQDIFVNFFSTFRDFFNFDWLKDFNRVFSWILQFGMFWLYLTFVLPMVRKSKTEGLVERKRIVEKTTVVVLVSAVFALFIITQLKSVEFVLEGFKTGNLNPRIFVREGFYQLIVACLVGISVFNAVKDELGKGFLTTLLLAEIFLVSIVAGERVWLYQHQFGLTQARVWGMLFLLFVFVVIAALFLNLFGKISDKIKWQVYLLGFSSVLVLAGFINVDRLMAVGKPPTINEKVDVDYMVTHLSYDAADYWIKGLKDVEPGLLASCHTEGNPDLCETLLHEFREEYVLTHSFVAFLYHREGLRFMNRSGDFDFGRYCEEEGSLLTDNLSRLSQKTKICDSYEDWVAFKVRYEEIETVLGLKTITLDSKGIKYNFVKLSPPSPTVAPLAPFQSCRTLGTKMIVGADGKGEIGCDVEVLGGFDRQKSYCEGQKTHIRKYPLIPDAYSRPNWYYATLTGLDLGEEVKVFVYTNKGEVECLPSLNK